MQTLAEMLPVRLPGVSAERIAAAERTLGRALPGDVVEFWRVSDGCEWIEFPDFSIQVYALDEAAGIWSLGPGHRAGHQRLVDLASGGSRERFCYDPLSGQIVLIDITWEDEEPGPPCGATLTEVVRRLVDGWNPLGQV